MIRITATIINMYTHENLPWKNRALPCMRTNLYDIELKMLFYQCSFNTMVDSNPTNMYAYLYYKCLAIAEKKSA